MDELCEHGRVALRRVSAAENRDGTSRIEADRADRPKGQAAVFPLLNKPCGVKRPSRAQRHLLGSGAPRRHPPAIYGPRKTCYNRFVRWRRARVWNHIMDALAAVRTG
jgi:hypothetical protein